jgi:hypothetical protein
MSVFENDYLVITPDPNEEQNFSTIYTITSKVSDTEVSAGSDKFIEKYTVTSSDSIKIVVTETSTLYVSLFGVGVYTFNCIINNIGLDKLSGLFIISENGTQFQKREIRANSLYQGSIRTYRLDDNKYFKL